MRREIVEAITALETEEGRITPERIVEAGHNPDSPLHSVFEWDDTKAAHEHRLDQARQLLRKVKFEVVINSIPRMTFAYVRDPESGPHSQGYRHVGKIRTELEIAREAVDAEFSAIEARMRRAKEIAEVLGFADEVSRRLEDLVELRAMLATATAAAGTEAVAH